MTEGRRLRIGDAERDHAADVLAEHLASGRIDVDEHAERLDAIYTARTGADLEPVFADLPSEPATPAPRARPRTRGGERGLAGRRRLPFLPVLAVLVLLSVLTHLPFWILIFFLGCGALGRRSHHVARAS